jgi:hypothetical protein
VGVCGNGVSLLGVGSTTKCSDSAAAGTPGNGDNGGGGIGGGNGGADGGNNGSGGSGGGSSLFDDAGGLVLAAAVPGSLAHGSLAFTGGNVELTALLGLGLAGVGGVMLRLRRFGYKG